MSGLLGAVLAGGAATRFGSDKALAPLGDITLMERALDSLRPHCAALVVVGRTQATVATAPDLPAAGLGPLGGIAGALAHARMHGLDAVLTTACDTPYLPPELVDALLNDGAAHAAEAPTVGIWPVRLLDPLLALLGGDGGDRSIRRWARAMHMRVVLPGVTVPNINTPDDLARFVGP